MDNLFWLAMSSASDFIGLTDHGAKATRFGNEIHFSSELRIENDADIGNSNSYSGMCFMPITLTGGTSSTKTYVNG